MHVDSDIPYYIWTLGDMTIRFKSFVCIFCSAPRIDTRTFCNVIAAKDARTMRNRRQSAESNLPLINILITWVKLSQLIRRRLRREILPSSTKLLIYSSELGLLTSVNCVSSKITLFCIRVYNIAIYELLERVYTCIMVNLNLITKST